jgi:hypothetical protein
LRWSCGKGSPRPSLPKSERGKGSTGGRCAGYPDSSCRTGFGEGHLLKNRHDCFAGSLSWDARGDRQTNLGMASGTEPKPNNQTRSPLSPIRLSSISLVPFETRFSAVLRGVLGTGRQSRDFPDPGPVRTALEQSCGSGDPAPRDFRFWLKKIVTVMRTWV